MGKPMVFDSREALIEEVSVAIMASGRTYEDIARVAGRSETTIARLARRDTKWPTPQTLFGVLTAIGKSLQLSD